MINQIKESHQKEKEEIKKAIEKKNCSEIERLTKENLAKDERINNLKRKESQFEGQE